MSANEGDSDPRLCKVELLCTPVNENAGIQNPERESMTVRRDSGPDLSDESHGCG